MSFEQKPNFFIVGAPKCGTTALAHYLVAHPDIFLARKEMHYFGSDLHFGPQFYRRDPDTYLAEFEGSQGRACIGESSVWYLFSRQAAAEIKAFNPKSRIIIMLRNPVDQLHAMFSAFRADGNENLATFKDALAAEVDRRAGRRIGRLAYLPQALVYHDIPRFTEQVKRYFDAFGRERVHVIIYDDFNADNAASYRETLDFLGVPSNGPMPSFEPVNANVNGDQSVRFRIFRDVLNDPLVRGSVIKLRAMLPRPVFAWVQKTGLRLNAINCISSATRRPAMDPALQQSLRQDFAPEIERLSALLGRDLTHWSRPAAPPKRKINPLAPLMTLA